MHYDVISFGSCREAVIDNSSVSIMVRLCICIVTCDLCFCESVRISCLMEGSVCSCDVTQCKMNCTAFTAALPGSRVNFISFVRVFVVIMKLNKLCLFSVRVTKKTISKVSVSSNMIIKYYTVLVEVTYMYMCTAS